MEGRLPWASWDSSNAPPVPAGDASNVFWGADVWYSTKKHWVLEAQRLVRAKRATTADVVRPAPRAN